jgi:hypothetical protein
MRLIRIVTANPSRSGTATQLHAPPRRILARGPFHPTMNARWTLTAAAVTTAVFLVSCGGGSTASEAEPTATATAPSPAGCELAYVQFAPALYPFRDRCIDLGFGNVHYFDEAPAGPSRGTVLCASEWAPQPRSHCRRRPVLAGCGLVVGLWGAFEFPVLPDYQWAI